MCGRVIQSSEPLRYAIVDGLDVRDSRLSNYPRRWNGAPSQEFLVIRQNHKTGERSLDHLRWGLIFGAALRAGRFDWSPPARWGLPGACAGEATPALDQPAWSATGVGACIPAHACRGVSSRHP